MSPIRRNVAGMAALNSCNFDTPLCRCGEPAECGEMCRDCLDAEVEQSVAASMEDAKRDPNSQE